METLKLLGSALGLASLAGLNLYLTVFVTGFAIHFHWIVLHPAYQQLEILGHPVVLILSGTLYLIEFFADKIPWIDSIWDAVHTFIRPIGATLLAIMVLGDVPPLVDVIVGILAAGMSLTTHGIKASARLIANSSPEPFSNVGLSVAEDVGVLGGLGLIAWNSLIALLLLLISFVVILWFLPRLIRIASVNLWFAWNKLQFPARLPDKPQLQTRLPAEYDILLHRLFPEAPKVEFAAKVMSGGGPKLPAYIHGWLVGVESQPDQLVFLSKRKFASLSQIIPLEKAKVSHEPRFLCESLLIYQPEQGKKFCFLLNRKHEATIKALVEMIGKRIDSAPIP